MRLLQVALLVRVRTVQQVVLRLIVLNEVDLHLVLTVRLPVQLLPTGYRVVRILFVTILVSGDLHRASIRQTVAQIGAVQVAVDRSVGRRFAAQIGRLQRWIAAVRVVKC